MTPHEQEAERMAELCVAKIAHAEMTNRNPNWKQIILTTLNLPALLEARDWKEREQQAMVAMATKLVLAGVQGDGLIEGINNLVADRDSYRAKAKALEKCVGHWIADGKPVPCGSDLFLALAGNFEREPMKLKTTKEFLLEEAGQFTNHFLTALQEREKQLRLNAFKAGEKLIVNRIKSNMCSGYPECGSPICDYNNDLANAILLDISTRTSLPEDEG